MVWSEYVSMTLKEITKYLILQVFCIGEGSIFRFEVAIRRPIGWMWQALKILKGFKDRPFSYVKICGFCHISKLKTKKCTQKKFPWKLWKTLWKVGPRPNCNSIQTQTCELYVLIYVVALHI
jgi:hypothetical protein